MWFSVLGVLQAPGVLDKGSRPQAADLRIRGLAGSFEITENPEIPTAKYNLHISIYFHIVYKMQNRGDCIFSNAIWVSSA